MRLVLDTNILIASLIKDSITRSLLLSPLLELYLPEYALEEIENHVSLISDKSGLPEQEIRFLLAFLLDRIKIITADRIKPHLNAANEIFGQIDPNDVPFIALALSFSNEGIWTNDPHFSKQKKIKVWATGDILKYVKGA